MTLRAPNAVATSTVLALVALGGCSYPTSGGAATSTSTSATSSSPTGAPISPTISRPRTTDATIDGYPLGQPVALDSGWTVSVDAVNLDAAAEMATLVPGVTATEGRLVLVTMSAQPTAGADVGELTTLALTLVVGLEADGERFGTCDGATDLIRPAYAIPAAGQTVTWQTCLDVTPAAAAPSAKIQVTTISGGAPVEDTTWSIS